MCVLRVVFVMFAYVCYRCLTAALGICVGGGGRVIAFRYLAQ